MGFNIPMKTSGAMSGDSLLAAFGSGNTGAPTQDLNQPMQNQGFNQPMQNQQSFNQPMQNQGFNQPMQNQGFNQPMQNQGFNQPMQNQQSFNQPMQNQGFNQPMQNQQSFNQPMQNQSFNQPAPPPKQRPAGGGVHLKKGQKFALAGAGGAQLTKINMGLGWDVTNGACDLDASAFMLDGNSRIIGDDWFVFYGQTVSPDNSIQHSGDSQGQGAGDDETISINLAMVSPQVQRIAFVVTINEALERRLNFSMVANAYVRIVDAGTNNEIARFNLTDYYPTVTAMVVGELYRHNGAWKFNPVGDGVAKDLAGLCAMYGVQVAD